MGCTTFVAKKKTSADLYDQINVNHMLPSLCTPSLECFSYKDNINILYVLFKSEQQQYLVSMPKTFSPQMASGW